MKLLKKGVCILLVLIFSIGNIAAFAQEEKSIESILNDTADFIYKTVTNPCVGSIGGEWTVLGLSRSGCSVPPQYYQSYYENLVDYLKEHDGNLHDKKYTEYSRVIVALTAIGKNPADVAGYNLLVPLADYEKTVWQGINGAIWALIALDCGNYEMPENPAAKVSATREMYVNRILASQLPDGGWALSGELSDPDITGMALSALSKYRGNKNVEAAIEKALLCISGKQNENGGFSSWDTENSESCVQIAVALCELGISIEDSRFTKNGNTVLDNLLTYYTAGAGFRHTYAENSTNLMATEQGLYCLTAIKRMQQGKNSLLSMDDATVAFDEAENEASGLRNKNSDVRKMEITFAGKTFDDIYAHENRQAIEALAARNIINGKTAESFAPDFTMTRAEFAAIIVKGLGLPIKTGGEFFDVSTDDWFCEYVNTAHFYGIVNGVAERTFAPYGTITREEAAVMIARAAKLCGMETELEAFAARDILAEFFDYVKSSDWAVSSLAFCYKEEILSNDVMEIKPKEAIVRAQVAQMLYNMLCAAKLI